MSPSSRLALAAALLATGAASAATETYTKDTYPTEVVKRPLELPAGMLEVGAALDVNLSADFVGKPVRLPFSALYGVDGKLQLGVSSGGFCLTGSDNGCGKFFNDLSFVADYGIAHQPGLDAALQAGLLFPSLSDNFAASVAVGIDLRVTQGQFAVRAGPKLVFGLAGRDDLNREFLRIPLDFLYQATPQLVLDLGIDLNLLLDPPDPYGFGDFLGIPVRLGAVFAVSRQLDVGGFFGFSNLLGKQSLVYGRSGVDDRVLEIFVAWRPL